MMTREEVYKIIDDERAYQDKTYTPTKVLQSGQTRQQRDLDVTAHLVLLDQYIEKAKVAWVTPGTNTPALQQIAKVAAIAVRALERAGASEDLLKIGLR